MSLFSLPVELVLSIVELVAWEEVDSHRNWVAHICLVCSTFRSAAQGPLYDTVSIDDDNMDDAVWTASLKDTPFLRTRSVTISVYSESLVLLSEGYFARAFANAEHLAASLRMLLSLAEHGQLLPCAMVSVTSELEDNADCDALRPMLDACTHLHILLSLSGTADVQRLLGPRTRQLIIDPMAAGDLQAERVVQMVEMLLSSPCERVLVRTLEIEQDAVQQFCTLVAGIARERQDTRLWIDDSPRHRDWSIFEHDRDGMRRGRGLWNAGRPLYVLAS